MNSVNRENMMRTRIRSHTWRNPLEDPQETVLAYKAMLILGQLQLLDHFPDLVNRRVLSRSDFMSETLESTDDTFYDGFVQLRIIVVTPRKPEWEEYMAKHVLDRVRGAETREGRHGAGPDYRSTKQGA